MPLSNRRPRLPLAIRRKIQAGIRYFAFACLGWITLWSCYVTVTEFHKFGDVLKVYGFNPGRRL